MTDGRKGVGFVWFVWFEWFDGVGEERRFQVVVITGKVLLDGIWNAWMLELEFKSGREPMCGDAGDCTIGC